MKAVVVDSRIIDLFTHFDIEEEIFASENIELAIENVKTPDEYVERCKDADVLLLIGMKTSKEIVDRLPNCKVIVRYGVGYDVVDVDACSKAGIVVCNIPDAGTLEVAGHAFALALNCARKITYYDRHIRSGRWHAGSGYSIHRYSEYTYGFCGFGNIARATAKYAANLNCKRIAYDPYIKDETFEQAGVTRVGFDELLSQSDIISVHAPLRADTYHMFSKEQFAKMKPGMIIVNTARGGVIDQDALMDALDAGIVAAAGLDVNEHEPLTDLNNRLFQYDSVVITPHSATESEEYFKTLQERAARTAIAVLKGELPCNVINRDAILRMRKQI
jgi:D-3-phosphoglycerate dehydrogenase / 2-oxoglutarate reductase